VSSSIDQKLLVDFVSRLLSPGRIIVGGLATRRAGALHRQRVARKFEAHTLTQVAAQFPMHTVLCDRDLLACSAWLFFLQVRT